MTKTNHEKTLLVISRISPEVAGKIINEIAGCQELNLLLSVSGGDVAAALAVYNTAPGLGTKITTHNVGCIASSGVILYLCGQNRIASPRTYFGFHKTQAKSHNEIVKGGETVNDLYARILIENTNLPSNFKLPDVLEFKDAAWAESVNLAHEISPAENIGLPFKIL